LTAHFPDEESRSLGHDLGNRTTSKLGTEHSKILVVTRGQINESKTRDHLLRPNSRGFRAQRLPCPMRRGAFACSGSPHRASQSTGMSIASTYHGVPLLCQVSASGRCKFKILRNGSKVASVRAGYRQVIDVVAIVIENAFTPYHGRLFDLRPCQPITRLEINNLPIISPALWS
jgi:hypothetical protein